MPYVAESMHFCCVCRCRCDKTKQKKSIPIKYDENTRTTTTAGPWHTMCMDTMYMNARTPHTLHHYTHDRGSQSNALTVAKVHFDTQHFRRKSGVPLRHPFVYSHFPVRVCFSDLMLAPAVLTLVTGLLTHLTQAVRHDPAERGRHLKLLVCQQALQGDRARFAVCPHLRLRLRLTHSTGHDR